MQIITAMLFHISLGFLYFQHAGGWPSGKALGPNHINVEMKDFSEFYGYLERSLHHDGFDYIPDWMQFEAARNHDRLSFFIRTREGEHFEGDLFPFYETEEDLNPRGPQFCEILFGNDRLFTTQPFFEEYVPRIYHHPETPFYPEPNFVYITMRGGPIFRAELRTYEELAPRYPTESGSEPRAPEVQPLPKSEGQSVQMKGSSSGKQKKKVLTHGEKRKRS